MLLTVASTKGALWAKQSKRGIFREARGKPRLTHKAPVIQAN